MPTLAQGVTEDGVRWSVQPFVSLDWDVTDDARDTVAILVDKYALVDIDTYDTSARNWAMHNGEPIIFDYGIGF